MFERTVRRSEVILAGVLIAALSLAPRAHGFASFDVPQKVSLGEAFQVAAQVHGEVEKSTISWRGKNRPFNMEFLGGGVSAGKALLGTDSAEKDGKAETLKIWIVSGGVHKMYRFSVDVLPKDYGSERLTVNPAMVTPPKSELERIKKERRLIRKALGTYSAEALWKLPFQRPVPGLVTSSYGKKRLFNGVSKSRHSGTDYRAAIGSPVKAASDGRVILTGDFYYSGKSVYVDHGGSVFSMYFHLSEIDVKKGDYVKAGQIIAKTGDTGRVTGPHLHFGVLAGGSMVNPEALISEGL